MNCSRKITWRESKIVVSYDDNVRSDHVASSYHLVPSSSGNKFKEACSTLTTFASTLVTSANPKFTTPDIQAAKLALK